MCSKSRIKSVPHRWLALLVCLASILGVGCAHGGGQPTTAAPTSCPNLSGSYRFTAESCHVWEGDPFEGLPLAAMGGYHVARDPQVIRIEQTDCSAVRFTARARLIRGDGYDVDETVILAGDRTRRLEWTSDGFLLEYRPHDTGPRFPGAGRQTSTLELRSTSDGILYRYRIVERGLALLLIPFRDVASAECSLPRVEGSNE